MKRFITYIMLLLAPFGFAQTPETSQQQKIRTAKRLAKKFLRQEGIPGMAISVSQNGELIWSEGFGYSQLQPETKIQPDSTQFRIASISKSITAFALAKMAEDKTINLDESIYTYLPDYPKQSYDFTVRQLGGNIAGIRHYKDNEFSLNKKMTITEGLDLFKNDSLLFEPATQFNYTSLGYVLLSEVMQKAAEVPFEDYLRERVLTPLNMQNTTVDASDVIIPKRTLFYRSTFTKKPIVTVPVANEFKVAGGGFLSTSEDIVKFGNEIINPTIITKEALSEVVTSQKLKNGNITGYGIGFSVETTKKGTPKYYHTGGGVGASTILMVFPAEGIVITVLTNLSAAPVQKFGEELETIFVDDVTINDQQP
jgi:serine beta-lactamase-like protein LACTB, mitochondrial